MKDIRKSEENEAVCAALSHATAIRYFDELGARNKPNNVTVHHQLLAAEHAQSARAYRLAIIAGRDHTISEDWE